MFDPSFRIITLPTSLPGKLGLSRLPGYEPSELTRDVDTIHAAGFTTVVSLIEESELHWLPGLADPHRGLFATLHARGLLHLRCPIKNLGVPRLDALEPVVDAVITSLREDKPVLVHCIAGLGRTGLFTACCLVKLGATPAQAMARVRAVRPGAIETPGQEAFVARFVP